MRFWWPGSRTPILLMSLWVGGRQGELEAGVGEVGNCGVGGGGGGGEERELGGGRGDLGRQERSS